jgi:hypothetical protein
MIDLNPLSVLKKRKMAFLPVHFVTTKINESALWDGSLDLWIESKLKGRYCITKIPAIDSQGKLKSVSVLGLEDQKEMTYFMLACPHVRR